MLTARITKVLRSALQVVGVNIIITGEVILELLYFIDQVITFQEILNEIIVCLVVMGSEETFCDIKVRDLFWRFISTLDYFLQDLYTLIIGLLY